MFVNIYNRKKTYIVNNINKYMKTYANAKNSAAFTFPTICETTKFKLADGGIHCISKISFIKGSTFFGKIIGI